MTLHLRQYYFGLRAVILGFTLILGSIAARAQQASVAPPPGGSKATTDADFIAAADEVLGQMSQITGLKLMTPLKKSLRSREKSALTSSSR